MTKKNRMKKVRVEDKKKVDEEKEECVRCGSRFKDKDCLAEHIREEHEFECSVEECGWRSKCKKEVEEHERNVHGIWPTYDQCDERFDYYSEMEEHWKIKHE